MRRPLVAAVASTLVALLPLSAARGADKGTVTLAPDAEVAVWHGVVVDPTGAGVGSPIEQTCTTTTCDVLRLRIAFPPDTFVHPRDGVLVSIKWATDYDQWNLMIDGPVGQRIAAGSAGD